MSPTQSDGRPRRVGYVVKMYPRLSETFIVDEILGLEQAGIEVSIFSLRAPNEGRFHSELSRVAATVEYLATLDSASVMDAFAGVVALPNGTASLERALDFAKRLAPQRAAGVLLQGILLATRVREQKIDHLHAHFMTIAAHTVYVAHLLCGVPFTVTAHAKDIYRETVDGAVFATVAAAAQAVVTVCDANRRYIEDKLTDDRARVVRIYNGVAVDELEADSAAERDAELVVAVGRLVEKKGFHVLLGACRALADRGVRVHCVVVGTGEERDRLLALRAELDLEDVVDFVGPLARDDVFAWMRRATALAAPCVEAVDGNRDALPTVLLEALAVGVPVVTTPVGGIPEIVNDGEEGLLVAENDAVALADALERLLRDEDLRSRLAKSGPAKARARFDRSRTIHELIALLSGPAIEHPAPSADAPV